MAKKFKLKLQLRTIGTVFAKEAFLETLDKKNRLEGFIYNPIDEVWEIVFKEYEIDDETLEVFIGSEGKSGSQLIGTVFINDTKKETQIIFNNGSKEYAKQSYKI